MPRPERTGWDFALAVTLGYLILGWSWIGLSDQIVALLPPKTAMFVQTVKGSGFVLLTGALLYWVLKREMRRRNRIEDRLRDSERDFRATIEDMAEIYYRTDYEGRIVRVSPYVTEALGYLPEEIIGRKLADLYVDPSGRARFLTRLKEAGGKLVNERLALRAKDGSTRWVSTNSHVWHDVDGQPIGVEGIARDITEELRRTEEAFRSARHLRRLVENLPTGAVFVEGNKLSINRVVETITGYPRNELASIDAWFRLLHGPDADRFRAEHEAERRRGFPKSCIIPIRRSDGRERMVEFSCHLLDQDEIWVLRDVTESQDMERALRRAVASLAASNTELEQFAYVASHDLREPLRMVTSYVQLITKRHADELSEEAKEFLAYARDGAERMDSLILDLLEYSRVGRKSQSFRPVSLAEAVRHAQEALTFAIEEAGAEIIIEGSLPEVPGDPSELMRLFQNLIGNAIKYRDSTRPCRIAIAAKTTPEGLQISVADNGIGIAETDFERIFRIFQRLHTREEYEGTGIGLALCKKIVERHGGRIWVESEVGRGSAFFFTLATNPA